VRPTADRRSNSERYRPDRSRAERYLTDRSRVERNCIARRTTAMGDAAVRKRGSVPETRARGNAAARRHSDRYHSRTVTTQIDDRIRSRQRYCSRRDPGVKRIDGTTARDVRECTARPHGLSTCIGGHRFPCERCTAAPAAVRVGLAPSGCPATEPDAPRAEHRRRLGLRPAAPAATLDPTSHARSDRSRRARRQRDRARP
jgi:hypothetical protein